MHYICTGGCQGISEEPMSCQAKTCKAYNQQLEPCDCEDGEHYGNG